MAARRTEGGGRTPLTILLEALQLRRGEGSTWAERQSRVEAVADFAEELIDSVSG